MTRYPSFRFKMILSSFLTAELVSRNTHNSATIPLSIDIIFFDRIRWSKRTVVSYLSLYDFERRRCYARAINVVTNIAGSITADAKAANETEFQTASVI